MALEDVYKKIGFPGDMAGSVAPAAGNAAPAAVGAAGSAGSVAPAAVLWDMDGTLVDSEEEWARVSGNVVRSHGGIWTDEDVLAIRGGGYDCARAAHDGRGTPRRGRSGPLENVC